MVLERDFCILELLVDLYLLEQKKNYGSLVFSKQLKRKRKRNQKDP